jgi:hypothetical protein
MQQVLFIGLMLQFLEDFLKTSVFDSFDKLLAASCVGRPEIVRQISPATAG